MEIEQIQDIDLEQLKKDIEADDNIVSFGLFYDRKRKKMYFVKHGDDGIIDNMVNKAAYSVSSFANVTIQQIAEALGMTVDLIDPKLADLAPLKTLTE